MVTWYIAIVVAYIVGMVSQKGGVGKSTLARLLARELAQNGFIPPTELHWSNLRFCESTDNYTAESANGLFYGAYQFEPRTWRTVGGTGNPAHAPPEEQDARARLLYARRGDQPWPRDYCGRFLPRN